MNSARNLGLCLILSLGLAQGAFAAPAPTNAISRGHQIAQRQCATCHAIAPGHRSPLRRAPNFQDLAGRFVGVSLQQKLTEIAETGHYDMPARRLHQDEVEDVVAYINSLERRKTERR